MANTGQQAYARLRRFVNGGYEYKDNLPADPDYVSPVQNLGACPLVTYANDYREQIFTKNDCPAGFFGNIHKVTVAAGTYSSTISKADANAQADAYLANEGQAVANANANCLSIKPHLKMTTRNTQTTFPTQYSYNVDVDFVISVQDANRSPMAAPVDITALWKITQTNNGVVTVEDFSTIIPAGSTEFFLRRDRIDETVTGTNGQVSTKITRRPDMRPNDAEYITITN